MKYLTFIFIIFFSLFALQSIAKDKWDADKWMEQQQKLDTKILKCEMLMTESFKNFENDEQCNYKDLHETVSNLYDELIKGLYKYPPSEDLKDVAIYEFKNPEAGLKSMQNIARDIDLLIYFKNMIILNSEK